MKTSVNEPSFDFIKADIFNFMVCEIYFGMWARRARRARRAHRARGHVGHVKHVGTWARWVLHLADSIQAFAFQVL